MNIKRKYIKYTAAEFSTELSENLVTFIQNMNNLGVDNLSFPEWYETFQRWLEVSTDMEEECWARDEIDEMKEVADSLSEFFDD